MNLDHAKSYWMQSNPHSCTICTAVLLKVLTELDQPHSLNWLQPEFEPCLEFLRTSWNTRDIYLLPNFYTLNATVLWVFAPCTWSFESPQDSQGSSCGCKDLVSAFTAVTSPLSLLIQLHNVANIKCDIAGKILCDSFFTLSFSGFL